MQKSNRQVTGGEQKGSKVRKGEHEGRTLGDRGNGAAPSSGFPPVPCGVPLVFAPLRPVWFAVEERIQHIKRNTRSSCSLSFCPTGFWLGAGRECERQTQRGRGAVRLRSQPPSPGSVPFTLDAALFMILPEKIDKKTLLRRRRALAKCQRGLRAPARLQCGL